MSTPAAEPISERDIRREVADLARRHERRRHLLPRALLVGAVSGLVAVLFRLTIDFLDERRTAFFAFCHRLGPWGALLPIVACAAGSAVAVWAVRRLAPETSGSGIPHVKAVLHRLRGLRWRRVLAVKFLSGAAGIGSGLTLGREGPTVQMGAAVGQGVSRWLRVTPRERQTLIAAGAGAGLAAAFNAPLAGVIFVLEELRRDFAPGTLTAGFVASVTGDVVTRYLLGQLPVFHVARALVPPLSNLPVFAALGLAAGLAGVGFNRTLLASLRTFDRFRERPLAVGAVVGAAVGLTGWFAPSVLGGGGRLVQQTLTGQVSLAVLPLLLLLRFTLTMGSYGSGAAGGIFAPLLVIGAQLGLLVGLVGERLLPAVVAQPTAFAVVGMGALFAAIVRAPLTGIVLILEMTENYSLMLPLLLACFVAYLFADLLRDEPIYEALLERDLRRSQEKPELEGTLLLDLVVQPGAAFAGRRLDELGLPKRALVVSVQRGLRSEVPTHDTVLKAGDVITVVVSPEAAAAVAMLKDGVESPPAPF
ncbi:MAG TPA: H(+)/Cl(-) exchange transporter ClcA [Thermoanaerobaculia bacterium]|jgi:CIC family chloride channel protein|nr:H(+)/Cl(-) exchange transporter ClcA [Thermoanaerobaculia bacterium]